MESIGNRRIETMKNYTITVNGNVYDVTVEEKGAAPAAPAPEAAVYIGFGKIKCFFII